MTTTARVADLAEQIRGVTFAKGDAYHAPADGFVPVLRAGNIQDGRLTLDDLVYVPAQKVHPKQYLRANDVVIATSSGSLDVVGKAARNLNDINGGFGAFLKVLRPGPNVDPGYFAHFFQTSDYRRRVSQLAAGANINNLRNEHLDEFEIALPPIEEQRRIAAILDQADAIRTKRRQALAHLDDLAESIYHAMFDGRDFQVSLLAEIATVSSGITKGRKTSSPTMPLPYLAVSNVQAGHLNLDVVKEIDATAAEIDKYALRDGDLVLTEGGDPDKLGRGTVWRGELPVCLHQNHIFRVRATRERVVPDFLSAFMASRAARAYFLRAAKQTTGIASINMTQLKALPVQLPPLRDQALYVRRVQLVQTQRSVVQRALAADDELFTSLQSRAFRGEL